MNSNQARLREIENDGVEFFWEETPLFRYVARSEVPPEECPKPYFHPLRNLHGDILTNHRPHDHSWHHGLSMTMTLVNRTNFWGGGSYRKGEGYRLRGNIGSQDHAGWLEKEVGEKSVRLVERVAWNNEHRATWLDEHRIIEAEVFPEHACWRLRLLHDFENVSGESLRMGTYESEEGLAGSHYTGLFMRLSRDFLSMGEKGVFGSCLADGRRGVEAVHGTPSPWMACVGAHDNSSAITTLIYCDHPGNPNFPTRWFHRTAQPSVGMPFVSSTALVLEPSAHFNLRHEIVIADGALDGEKIAGLLESLGHGF